MNKYLIFGLICISFSCVKKNLEEVNPKVTSTNPDWTSTSHGNDIEPDYNTVFPQEKVNTLQITIGKTNWEAIKADMVAKNKGEFGVGGGTQPGGGGVPGGGMVPGGGGVIPNFGEEPAYVETTIKFNGKNWEKVGFRLKGNSTLNATWKSGIYKLPFRLNFDRYEETHPEIKNQRFYGFKELSFSPGVKDNSLIREKVTADIFRMAGIPAAQTAFYKVYIDFGEGLKYCGIYAMIEIVDDTMIKSQFGENKGNIYKPESNFVSFNMTQFEKKNNETEADYSDVKGAVAALNASNRTSDAAAWRSNLEKYMNMDHFVKWLAINSTLMNWDTYGGIAHNYYLFNHPTKKLTWIPWDNNEALTSQERIKLNLSGVANNWPLIKFVAEDSIYYAKYKGYVKDFNENTFTTSKMNAIFEKATDLISPHVNGTEKEVAPYSNLTNVSNFTAALPFLKSHVVARNNAVKAFVP